MIKRLILIAGIQVTYIAGCLALFPYGSQRKHEAQTQFFELRSQLRDQVRRAPAGSPAKTDGKKRLEEMDSEFIQREAVTNPRIWVACLFGWAALCAGSTLWLLQRRMLGRLVRATRG